MYHKPDITSSKQARVKTQPPQPGRAASRFLSRKNADTANLQKELRGPVRLARRTKDTVPTLAPGTIVILAHPDLDAVAARALAARRPLAIVNTAPFVSGRYPNRGPQVLLDAQVPLFDLAIPESGTISPDLFTLFSEHELARIESGNLCRADGVPVALLVPLTPARLASQLADARGNLDTELSQFAENTLRYLGRDDERRLLLDPVNVPEVPVRFAGRAALVAVRGENYEDDLQQLGSYIREQKPVLVAVDGAADALLHAGLRPDIILGDMDSVSDAALQCGAHLVVHAYADTRANRPEAPGMARIRALGLSAQLFPVGGTSEDAALLMAYEKGAELIVAVGTHTNLEDFLDKGRAGMASTFLVRLKVGSRLVDARGVSRLYTARSRVGPMLAFLFAAAAFPALTLLAATPPGQIAWRAIVVWFRLWFR